MSLVMCSTTHVHVDALSKNFKLQNKQEIGRLRRIGVQTLCTTWRSFYSPYADRRRKICADYLYASSYLQSQNCAQPTVLTDKYMP